MVYLGSKTKYAKHIVPILQQVIDNNNITTFIDGCCGGCNIIDKIKCENRIAIDKNASLIDLYNHAVTHGTEDFPAFITKEDWDYRKEHQDEEPLYLTALTSIFCSYSARGFRGGYACNGSRNFYQERLNNFNKQLPNLQDIKFICADINDLEVEGAVIYIDPPYKGTKTYDVKDFNYETFWNTVRRLSQNNLVFVSEQQAPEDFLPIWSLPVKRNCFGTGRTETTENLFVYKFI